MGDYALRRWLYQFETISHRDYICVRDFQAGINLYEEQLLNMKLPIFNDTCNSISTYVIWNRNRNAMCNIAQNKDIYIDLETHC